MTAGSTLMDPEYKREGAFYSNKAMALHNIKQQTLICNTCIILKFIIKMTQEELC